MLTDLIILLYHGLQRLLQPIKHRFATPAWVRNFPYESDKAALTQLSRNTKGPLHSPREMVYVLSNMSGKQAVENAIFAIEQEGWQCTALAQEAAPGKTVIECRKNDYSLDIDNYTHDMAFFNRMASLYRADFDGWYAGGQLHKEKPEVEHAQRRLGWIAVAIVLSLVIRGFIVWHFAGTTQASASQDARDAHVANDAASAAAQSAQSTAFVPAKGFKLYTSQDLGVIVRYPDNWAIQANQPCVENDPATVTQECQIQLNLKDWHQRYGPSIMLERMSGSFSDVQFYIDAQMAAARSQNPSVTWHKETMQINGRFAAKYVQTIDGVTTISIFVPDGDKVLGLVASTPKGQPKGLDYFAVFDDIIASLKLLH